MRDTVLNKQCNLIVNSVPKLREAGDLGNKEWSKIEVNLSTPAKIIEAILYNDRTEVNRINQDYWTG